METKVKLNLMQYELQDKIQTFRETNIETQAGNGKICNEKSNLIQCIYAKTAFVYIIIYKNFYSYDLSRVQDRNCEHLKKQASVWL